MLTTHDLRCPTCATQLTEALRCPGCGRWWEARVYDPIAEAMSRAVALPHSPPPWVGSGYGGPPPEPAAHRVRWATGGRKAGAP